MTTNTEPCSICATPSESISDGDGIHQCCPRCGEFRLTLEATKRIGSFSGEEKVKLSGWVRDQNILGDMPEITSDRIERIATFPMPGIIERADSLLTLAIRGQTSLGEMFSFYNPMCEAVSYSKDNNEVEFLLGYLNDRGLIKHRLGGGYAHVSPEGYIRYEEIHAKHVASSQGFVAMWFDHSMQDTYEQGFEVGVREAGYDPVRVDQMEHIGKIDDEIIAQIRRSRFIVADFTGHRSGVYFEAGFALGLNLPVFWTCRKDMIDDLHFDIRQFNCIVWESPQDLAKRLKVRIEAVIGMGPRNL